MADPRRRLILFTRFPAAGKVKTRLIPALGAEGAAAVHRRLVLRTLRTASALCQRQNVELEIRFAGESVHELGHWLGDGWRLRPQCGGELGERMADAFAASFAEGSTATVIIGCDCPALTPGLLDAAFAALQTRRVVFGPATDGGYYLIGQTAQVPGLFQTVAWGTGAVLAQSLEILARQGIQPGLLEPLADVDRPEDLAGWRRITEPEDADLTRVSVIIPALNESARLAATLRTVFAGRPWEVLVVDGGSADDTRRQAGAAGATALVSAPGRARQMNAGAARASGGVLLFLHADTSLPAGWPAAVTATLAVPGVVAGAFAFQIADDFFGRGWVERVTNLRSRCWQNPYGDQALFLRRAVFEELGGFADLPIMEDCELNRRLRRRGKIAIAAAAARTSGRRWQALGAGRTTLINQLVTFGYRLGVPPRKLARLYRP